MSAPEPYWASGDGDVVLHLDDCLDVLRTMEADSIDAVVTDPPYGLEFMGREWDGASGFRRSLNEADASRDTVFGRTSRTSPEFSTGSGKFSKSTSGSVIEWPSNQGWNGFRCRNCGRLGHGGGACTCETPDFIRADTRWNVFQEWCEAWSRECLRVLRPNGYLLAFGGTRTYHRMACGIEDAGFDIRDSIDWLYGTGFPKNEACLKPAHEPIAVARKPARRSEPLPGLDACMVAHADAADLESSRAKNPGRDDLFTPGTYGADRPQQSVNDAGRWPPNVLLSGDAAAELDRQSGLSTSTGGRKGGHLGNGTTYGRFDDMERANAGGLGDSGGASRFFPVFKYEPKAPASERPRLPDGTVWPTVKPLDLMRWLVRLVTPPGGTVLDLFAGSGTTAEACIVEGFRCVLIDKDPVAAELIKTRLHKPIQPVLFGEAS